MALNGYILHIDLAPVKELISLQRRCSNNLNQVAMRHTLYYIQRNQGKFILVETKGPTGYFGDWTDIDHPGTAGTPLLNAGAA